MPGSRTIGSREDAGWRHHGGGGERRYRRVDRRVEVFSDVQGHLLAFQRGLAQVGVDVEDRRVPSDLVVIQVGDLVHRGPLSNDVQLAGRSFLGIDPSFRANAARTLSPLVLTGQLSFVEPRPGTAVP
jgi:hypothetical protein